LRAFDEELPHRHGQFESSRSGAAGIHKEHSVTPGYGRFVGMAADDDFKPAANGITVQLLYVVDDE
jgi:hypothetical protein